MSTKKVSVGTLQKGKYVVLEDAPCRVTDIQVSRPGKHGHAKVRITAVGIIDEKKRTAVMPGHDEIDSPILEKRTAQVLSVANNKAQVMDAETFETFDIEIPDEMKTECVEGANILYWKIMDSKVMKQIKAE